MHILIHLIHKFFIINHHNQSYFLVNYVIRQKSRILFPHLLLTPIYLIIYCQDITFVGCCSFLSGFLSYILLEFKIYWLIYSNYSFLVSISFSSCLNVLNFFLYANSFITSSFSNS